MMQCTVHAFILTSTSGQLIYKVRCNDLGCCSSWRSSLQHLLPGRFLPNPVSAKHSGQGIVASDADRAPTFLPLFVNLQLNSMIKQDKMEDFMIRHMIYTVHPPSHILVSVAVQCVAYTMLQPRALSVTQRSAILEQLHLL